MPNGKKHFETGFIIGAIYSGIKNYNKQQRIQAEYPMYEFNWIEFGLKTLFGGSVGGIAGVLPDIIEPATSPRHRKTFHSISAAIVLAMATDKANKSANISLEKKEYINIASLAYGSHLFLDSETPTCIPII